MGKTGYSIFLREINFTNFFLKLPQQQFSSEFSMKTTNVTFTKFLSKCMWEPERWFPYFLRCCAISIGDSKIFREGNVWKRAAKRDQIMIFTKESTFFIKWTFLLKKLLKSWFHEIFECDRVFSTFPTVLFVSKIDFTRFFAKNCASV